MIHLFSLRPEFLSAIHLAWSPYSWYCLILMPAQSSAVFSSRPPPPSLNRRNEILVSERVALVYPTKPTMNLVCIIELWKLTWNWSRFLVLQTLFENVSHGLVNPSEVYTWRPIPEYPKKRVISDLWSRPKAFNPATVCAFWTVAPDSFQQKI